MALPENNKNNTLIAFTHFGDDPVVKSMEK